MAPSPVRTPPVPPCFARAPRPREPTSRPSPRASRSARLAGYAAERCHRAWCHAAAGEHIRPPQQGVSAHETWSARGALRTACTRRLALHFPSPRDPADLAAPGRVAAALPVGNTARAAHRDAAHHVHATRQRPAGPWIWRGNGDRSARGRTLGVSGRVRATARVDAAPPDDGVTLMANGLYDATSGQQIAQILGRRGPLDAMADHLARVARAHAAPDGGSRVLVRWIAENVAPGRERARHGEVAVHRHVRMQSANACASSGDTSSHAFMSPSSHSR